jgi:DNA (cytosine-5)-methyltransferase 1
MDAAGFTCRGAAELTPRLQKEYPLAFNLAPKRMFGNLHKLTQKEEWMAVRKSMMGCVLTAGFPCQPFSKSGNQLGKEHTEGTVFGSLVDILIDLECSGFILENVENLTGERHGKTFEEMKNILHDHHYDIAYAKYSPHLISIPQHRQRWFILGIRRSDNEHGVEDARLSEEMEDAILSPPKPHIRVDLMNEILTSKAMRKGKLLTSAERDALLLWDQYLAWLVENRTLGETPSPLWGMEAEDAYYFDRIQTALRERKSRRILKDQLLNVLKGHRKAQAKNRRYTKAQIIDEYLPPYLSDLATRTKPYPDWKETYINQSRNHMLAVKKWLRTEGRADEWKCWEKRLLDRINSHQKLEWNIRDLPLNATSADDTQRLKRRFGKYLIQFRSSGIRVGRSDRHPALVAIGQVPVVGRYLRRPTWQTLAKLQSIPDDFVASNTALLGKNGEPVTRLGNAVNVRLVELMAGVLKGRLRTITPS